ncbi:hypothetical protein K1719_026215 [Acacia pycnantha]|nr:hypothetical protein K1719_026215 [Acacia pycnantha]
MACSVSTLTVNVKIPFGYGIPQLEWLDKCQNLLTIMRDLYSLKIGIWRKVEVGNLDGVYGFNRWSALPCNGSIFWTGQKAVEGHSKSRLDLIVSFDIVKEGFTLTPFPTMISLQQCCDRLPCYENKLAIFFPNSESHGIALWGLEECADPSKGKCSWAKIYNSRPDPYYRFFICPEIIWRNEIVFLVEAIPEYEIEEDYEGRFVLGSLTLEELNIFVLGCASAVFCLQCPAQI